MKKIIILGSALCLLGSYSANAQISIGIGIPVQPVYVAPVYEPGYVVAPDYPSYRYDHHRYPHNDYWAHHQHDERGHR